MSAYDSFAEIYDAWTDSAAQLCDANRRFYVEEYLATAGPVVELGVGDGRIALEAARRGKALVGVDDSEGMLARCRARAEAEGSADRVRLLRADMRAFELDEPAALIALPFHSIGHLLSLEDKAALARHVFGQLAPGGRFVFDHYVHDPKLAERHLAPHVRAEYVDADTGLDTLLWVQAVPDVARQRLRVYTWTDELDEHGVVVRRKYRNLDFSWLHPEQSRALLEDAGFAIETVYGDFDRAPFGDASTEQIWVARKPG